MGKRNGSLAQGEVVAFFGGVVVEMDADQSGSQPTEMLFVVEKTEGMFGGCVTKVVPVAERGCGKTGEEHVPRIIGRNFPGIFAAFQTKTQTEGLGPFS